MVFSAKYGRIRSSVSASGAEPQITLLSPELTMSGLLLRGQEDDGEKKRTKKDSKIFSKYFHFWKASHTNKVQKLYLL